MNTPFFIARRYLFAPKSRNVINIISGITVAGIALASMAMICTLSVFNGFHELIESLFTDFDPEVRIVSSKGKVFNPSDSRIAGLGDLPYVEAVTHSLQEQALIRYNSSQYIVTVMGVEDNLCDVYELDNVLRGSGEFLFRDNVCDYAIPGIGLINHLDCGIQPVHPFTLYAPKRGTKVNLANPAVNFNSETVYASGLVFQVNQQPYDDSYVIVSMELARSLFGYEAEVSSIDLKISEGYSLSRAIKEITELAGDDFKVMDRYEQQADVFKVVRLEKFISFLFLTFILLIACFNIIASLVMLMVDKERDSAILGSLGMTPDAVSRIFVYDGLLISIVGSLVGLALGVILALLQQRFGFIPLGANGGFIVDSYPVCVRLTDVVVVLLTVTLVTLLSAWPIRRIADRMFSSSSGEAGCSGVSRC